MKKNIFSRSLCFALCSLMLSGAVMLSASANSAQSWFQGVDSTGTIMPDGQSPIVVEHELLTFDLQDFPSVHGDLSDYTAKVSAEYTFYNPSEYTVTARLLFPFGNVPTYAYYYTKFDDTEKYDVTINGEAIEKQIRYTLSDPYAQFDLDRDLSLVCDDFVQDDFYRPELTVTKYVFSLRDLEYGGSYRALSVAFDLPKGIGDYRFYFPEQNRMHTQADGDVRLSCFVNNMNQIDLYVFGTPPTTLPELKFYQDGGVEDGEEVSGEVDLLGSSTMTFEQFALSSLPETSSIQPSDWYNAVVAELNERAEYLGEYPYACSDRLAYNFERYFMRWYQYEITLAPGERIVNTVTAPIYPSVDLDYEPDIFEYTYLLSPAKTWKSFGELEIVVNTPHYITESGIDGFTKGMEGYYLKLDGLPDGELTFTLSTAETPKHEPSPYAAAFTVLSIVVIVGVIIAIALVLAAIGGIVVAIVFICQSVKKRKEK